ncbi:uncharacterized protein LOC135483395 isoform X2 [Lineus longissimus]|uniref:uncharacterized protein LOC135483395 isoform X2 n=1 Tax=Lineus longissimus TaxID=88925 RepID=UPI00315D74CD
MEGRPSAGARRRPRTTRTACITTRRPPQTAGARSMPAYMVDIRPLTTATTSFFYSQLQHELAEKYKVPLFIKKPKMRIFVSFQEERCTMDIPHGKTVAEVKLMVQEKFFIQPNRIAVDGMDTEKNILVLSYAGAELGDDWILTDIGVSPGSTIHAYLKEELRPIVYIFCAYNQDLIQVLEKFKFMDTFISDLRAIASRKTGLPVGVFRLTKEEKEMYDIHTLDMYDMSIGDTVNLETWDGWNDFLNLAAMGFTSHALTKLSADELVARYQMKVAMYIAAHYGHVDLAVSLIRQGIRPDEPIGEHPYRQWCASTKHIDSLKCPVHEAVESGQLGVLRTFVHHNICTVMAKDGNGLRPLNIALRNRVKPCASFLLTKQWSRINYGPTSIPLSLYAKMKAWGERGKEKALLIHGQEKSTLKRKPILEHPLVGQGVYVDGFSECQMSTKSKAITQADRERNRVLNFEPGHREFFRDDPESYFRNLQGPRHKHGRFNKIIGMTKSKLPADDKASEKSFDHHASRSPDKHPSSAASAHDPGDGKEDGDRIRLPPIMEKGKRSSHAFTNSQGGSPTKEGRLPSLSKMKNAQPRMSHDRDGSETPSSIKSTYIETGKEDGKQKVKREILNSQKSQEDEGEKKKRSRSAALLAKAKTADGAIPLPMSSIECIPKPVFHVKSHGADVARSTLDSYERHRGMKARDYAIKCLSVASTFKEKPWLHQVRLAMALTTQGVKKNVTASLGQREPEAATMERLGGLY